MPSIAWAKCSRAVSAAIVAAGVIAIAIALSGIPGLDGTDEPTLSGLTELTAQPSGHRLGAPASASSTAGRSGLDANGQLIVTSPTALESATPTAGDPRRTTSTKTPSARPTSASTGRGGCYPVTDSGACYRPGQYCRASQHGTIGQAADGRMLRCLDLDGWRWELVTAVVKSTSTTTTSTGSAAAAAAKTTSPSGSPSTTPSASSSPPSSALLSTAPTGSSGSSSAAMTSSSATDTTTPTG